MLFKFFVVLCSASIALTQHNPHQWENRSTMVHLFEWKWSDIAAECERFLAPKGYGGVQISPPNENVVVNGRPWWERYQPMSYLLTTRSGFESDFADMARRCNNVGVRIYVDVVFNHMAAEQPSPVGTGGSTANIKDKDFPAVPYTMKDFHPSCQINNYNDPYQVRNCELVGLKDLNQTVPWVRDRIVDFLNHLIDLGVAGFRVDAAKHMWPEDLKAIYSRIKNLNTQHGFPANSKPFITQEVIDLGGEVISKFEYNSFGTVTEFKFGAELGRAFYGRNDLKWLKTFGPDWGMLPSKDALVFIDNHDNQRGDDPNILTYKNAKQYKMATAFGLAYNYGIPRVMSSFAFTNMNTPPPTDERGNLISPSINRDDTCGNGYICEHRWRQIYNMVGFKNAVRGTQVTNWWDNGKNQIAFCRGNKGFIAFNGDNVHLNQRLQTCLPPGQYCDIISGSKTGASCSGKKITVDGSGFAQIALDTHELDGVLAIHVESKV
uniref:Alpha-amylase n=1 Tax=Dolopus genitalis TaxID=2488630 RepID=A0A3G5BII4_DOLGE|nr:venom polypeptide [Dolopus genitalis]